MTYPVYWFLWFLLCSDNASHKCEQCSEIGELHCGWLVDLDLDVVVVVPYSSFGMKVHGVGMRMLLHMRSPLYTCDPPTQSYTHPLSFPRRRM